MFVLNANSYLFLKKNEKTNSLFTASNQAELLAFLSKATKNVPIPRVRI
jgi:hypothetical protein